MTSRGKQHDHTRRTELFQEQDGLCFYCTEPMLQLPFRLPRSPLDATLEHLTPFSEGGRRGFPNEVAACHGCNTQRGTTSWLLFFCLKELERAGTPGARA
ncbi:HNH endonuclease [Hyphomicrobium sp. DY-1]|jgi:5-methylcytosine-specific restriction endonuclease McrA|uniref:HNH endonuclease n=1 Tax=Hyphomicrobium sp. DY-1 TaxID=3075650 RepID=UPI0039C2872B